MIASYKKKNHTWAFYLFKIYYVKRLKVEKKTCKKTSLLTLLCLYDQPLEIFPYKYYCSKKK